MVALFTFIIGFLLFTPFIIDKLMGYKKRSFNLEQALYASIFCKEKKKYEIKKPKSKLTR